MKVKSNDRFGLNSLNYPPNGQFGSMEQSGHNRICGCLNGIRRPYGIHCEWCSSPVIIRRITQDEQAASLQYALGHHGMSHLHETGNVRAFHVVDVTICAAVAQALGMNVAHDLVQTGIHLLCRP